ncbi:hypothetical protein [Pseudosulfitobacter sp. DSM 107133]|nr:hypothetical protein [Pseudosulfitobacter sp. DSM 107133]
MLDAPTDVSLAPGVSIVGTEKVGGDLVVGLSNGETLHLDDFFVIGPDGDFSRLMSASGEPLVTGLMGPEPDFPQSAETTEAMQSVESPATSSPDAAGSDADADGWGDLALITGAGFTLGSGISFLSGGGGGSDSGAQGPEVQFQVSDQAEFAAAIEELTGPEDQILQDSEFDTEFSAAAPPESDFSDAEITPEVEFDTKMPETDGFLSADSTDPSLLPIADAQDNLLIDLMTEVI